MSDNAGIERSHHGACVPHGWCAGTATGTPPVLLQPEDAGHRAAGRNTLAAGKPTRFPRTGWINPARKPTPVGHLLRDRWRPLIRSQTAGVIAESRRLAAARAPQAGLLAEKKAEHQSACYGSDHDEHDEKKEKHGCLLAEVPRRVNERDALSSNESGHGVQGERGVGRAV